MREWRGDACKTDGKGGEWEGKETKNALDILAMAMLIFKLRAQLLGFLGPCWSRWKLSEFAAMVCGFWGAVIQRAYVAH